MRRGAFLLVLALFAALALLWTRREEAVRRDVLHVYDHPLLPDFAPERVVAVRIDHLRLGTQLRLERDAAGRWLLTDPVAYPGYAERVAKLLAIVARERGPLEAGLDLAELELAPPVAVLELDGREEDGSRRTWRVEVGGNDVDPLRVHVRVPGHRAAPAGEPAALLRVSRALANALEQLPDDWRDPRLTPFLGTQVARFERHGEGPFEAVQGDAGWQTVEQGEQASVRLDPGAIGLLVRCAAELRAQAFVDDAPLRPGEPRRFGLDEPDLRIGLFDGNGEGVELLFARAARQGRWVAARADLPNVFAVEPSDVELLRRPLETLYDQTLVRMLRPRLVELRLEREGGSLLLEKRQAVWSVVLDGRRFPADEGRVGDLLSALEAARVAAFVPGLAFPPDAPPVGFTLRFDDGTRQGAELGPRWRDAARGVEGRMVRRSGEQVVGLVDEALARQLATPLDELRSRRVHLVPERLVERVRLRHGDQEQLYLRRGTRWSPHGLDLDAPRAFLDLLDALLGLRVERWPAADEGRASEPLAPDASVAVVLSGSFGEPLRFTLGRGADGEGLLELSDGARGVVRRELVEALLALFGPS